MKPELIEGGGVSQFKAVIKALGHNRDVDIEFATVTSASPLRIKIDNMPLELDGDDFAVCAHLTAHSRQATVGGGSVVTIAFETALKAGDRVVVASYNSGQGYVILDRVGGV